MSGTGLEHSQFLCICSEKKEKRAFQQHETKHLILKQFSVQFSAV